MTPYDPDWLDRMYNNRALVPECVEHFAHWARMSEHARTETDCHIDIPYGDSPLQKLDVFPAVRNRADAPVMVFIHGGYWRSLDKSDHSFIAPPFNNRGACVVVVNYDLCPEVAVPDIALQCAHALAWVWRNIAAYGGDPRRISVVGHSAGGHLAAMMMLCQWQALGADLPARLVHNAMSISGLFDLEPVSQVPFLKDSLRLTPDHVLRASTALLPKPASGQLYALAGGNESPEFIRQNLLIGPAWGKQRVPVCETLPGLNHFNILEALVQQRHRLYRLALGLLQT